MNDETKQERGPTRHQRRRMSALNRHAEARKGKSKPVRLSAELIEHITAVCTRVAEAINADDQLAAMVIKAPPALGVDVPLIVVTDKVEPEVAEAIVRLLPKLADGLVGMIGIGNGPVNVLSNPKRSESAERMRKILEDALQKEKNRS